MEGTEIIVPSLSTVYMHLPPRLFPQLYALWTVLCGSPRLCSVHSSRLCAVHRIFLVVCIVHSTRNGVHNAYDGGQSLSVVRILCPFQSRCNPQSHALCTPISNSLITVALCPPLFLLIPSSHACFTASFPPSISVGVGSSPVLHLYIPC